jgi:hypothetical protein
MDSNVLDEMLRVKGALGGVVVAFGGVLTIVFKHFTSRLDKSEAAQIELKHLLAEQKHTFELAVQKFDLIISSLTGKK